MKEHTNDENTVTIEGFIEMILRLHGPCIALIQINEKGQLTLLGAGSTEDTIYNIVDRKQPDYLG